MKIISEALDLHLMTQKSDYFPKTRAHIAHTITFTSRTFRPITKRNLHGEKYLTGTAKHVASARLTRTLGDKTERRKRRCRCVCARAHVLLGPSAGRVAVRCAALGALRVFDKTRAAVKITNLTLFSWGVGGVDYTYQLLATARSDVLLISSHNGQFTGGYTDRQSVSRPELKKGNR